jgi:acyl carrier protein
MIRCWLADCSTLQVVELIMFLEGQYKVDLDDDEVTPDNLDTINAIVSLLERKGVS